MMRTNKKLRIILVYLGGLITSVNAGVEENTLTPPPFAIKMQNEITLDEAKIYLREKNYRELSNSSLFNLASSSEKAKFFYIKGVANYRSTYIENALKDFKLAFDINNLEENWKCRCLYAKAITQYRLEKFHEALKDFQEFFSAISPAITDQELSAAWYGMGVTNLKLENFSQAIDNFENALSLKKLKKIEVAHSHNYMGMASYQLKDYKESIKHFYNLLNMEDYLINRFLRGKTYSLFLYNFGSSYIEKNPKKALEIFRELLKNKLLTKDEKIQLYFQIATAYFKLDIHEQALKWFKKAAKREHLHAQICAAGLLQKVKNLEDFNKSAIYFEMAALQGHQESQYNLALMLYEGRGNLAKDTEKSKMLLEDLAKKGHVKAKESLDLRVLRDESVPIDIEKAAKFFFNAMQKDPSIFHSSVLPVLQEEKSDPTKRESAIKLMKLSAHLGYSKSKEFLNNQENPS